MRLLFASLAVAMVFLVSCEGRQPLNHGEVVAIANHYQIHESVAWGEPTEVLAPDGPDDQGHTWWQVRYADGPAGERRIMLVDGQTGWARMAWPGYAMRKKVIGNPSSASPVVIDEGHFVLVLTPAEPPDHDRHLALDREVARLNELASQTGLAPLFYLRIGASGSLTLVFGWQGDRGIAKDDRVQQWMLLRTPYHDGKWLDLSQP